MKTIILYASKSGAARECAELLASKLPECAVYDLKNEVPDIRDAEMVIIGAGVRMGKTYGAARRFINKNLDTLTSKRTALYLCNADPETYEKAVEKNFPAELITHSICTMSFGGKMPFRTAKNPNWMLKENVEAFIEAVSLE